MFALQAYLHFVSIYGKIAEPIYEISTRIYTYFVLLGLLITVTS